MICDLPAVEIAALIRRKQLSAREVLDAHLTRIAARNPKVNAIVTLDAGRARQDADRADEEASRGEFRGPLHGLPIAHKDLEDTAGMRTTYGSPIFRDHVPLHSSLIVERIRGAGAIAIGKTNTPEFGAGSQTFNPVFGATLNPYNFARTCGGSSGGAAVGLACGMFPIADGSDMGGSLRNPASFCNVVGMRPSPGLVPRYPCMTAFSSLSVLGPLARTVADVALLLGAIAGPDPRDPLSIDRMPEFEVKNVRGAKIAWYKDLGGIPFARDVRAVVDAQAGTFRALGCTVDQDEPDFADADRVFRVLRALSFHASFSALLPAHRSQIKDTVVGEIELGARLAGSEVADAEVRRTRLFHRVANFFTRYDYFVLPVSQVPPFDVNQPYITEIEGTRLSGYIDWMRSCYYISVLGLPAISVPAGFTPDGLPVGLQIVGRFRDDAGVLRLAHAFEQAAGVRRNSPPLMV